MSTPGTQRRKDRLAQIEKCVCNDRQNTYGDAEDNFANIAEYWTLWLRSRKLLQAHARVEAHDVAVMSGLIKVARLSTSPDHIDNWDDLAGYAVCGGGIRMPKATFKSGEIITKQPTAAINVPVGSEWQHIQTRELVAITQSKDDVVGFKTSHGIERSLMRDEFIGLYALKHLVASSPVIPNGSEWENIQTDYRVRVLSTAGGVVSYMTYNNQVLHSDREDFLRQFVIRQQPPTPTT